MRADIDLLYGSCAERAAAEMSMSASTPICSASTALLLAWMNPPRRRGEAGREVRLLNRRGRARRALSWSVIAALALSAVAVPRAPEAAAERPRRAGAAGLVRRHRPRRHRLHHALIPQQCRSAADVHRAEDPSRVETLVDFAVLRSTLLGCRRRRARVRGRRRQLPELVR